MKKTENMFSENKLSAYVSSALTMSDKIQGDRIKALNSKIKEWLNEIDIFGYLPQEYSDPSLNDMMSPEEIYILDRWRIAESDFVIMNLDKPAFGVGQEAEIASSSGIPIIPFHYYKTQVSRIIRGIPGIFIIDKDKSPENSIIQYEDITNFNDLKDKLLSSIKRLISQLKNQSDEEINKLPDFSEYFVKAMRNRGETVESLSEKTGLSRSFISALTQDYKSIKKMLEPFDILKIRKLKKISINKYSNPGLWILQKLSKALHVNIGDLIGEERFEFDWLEPLVLAANKGLKLEQLLNIIPKTDYKIYYTNAARFQDSKKAKEEIANEMLELVKKYSE